MRVEIKSGVSQRVVDDDRLILMIKMREPEAYPRNPERKSNDQDNPKSHFFTAFTIKRSAKRLGMPWAIR